MLDVPPGVSPGQPGANSRPPLAAEATCQLLTGPTDHGPGPVSYTHLTLPTTPYV